MGLLGLARAAAKLPAWRRPAGMAEPAGGKA
jgi:hypothetical protein